eukprot:gene26665-biopygen17105
MVYLNSQIDRSYLSALRGGMLHLQTCKYCGKIAEDVEYCVGNNGTGRRHI